MRAALRRMYPSGEAERIDAIAEIWESVAAAIVEAILRCAEEDTRVHHIDTRAQQILKLAHLMAHLQQVVFDDLSKDRIIDQIQPDAERARFLSPQERAKIEHTGAMYYEQVWKPFLADLGEKHPLVVGPGEPSRRKNLIAPRGNGPGTRLQHYSPTFSNRHWALAPRNELRIYSLGVGLTLESRDKGYRTWGREEFLYSQDLESHLGLVEGDAQKPYEKLLSLHPLTPDEINRWVAFIAVQHIRTPGYISRLLRGLRNHKSLDERHTKVELLRRGYEQMFVAAPVFATYHQLVASCQWLLLGAPTGKHFIRGDEPVVIGALAAPWRLIYPMSPSRCFAVGPNAGKLGDAVLFRTLDRTEVDSVNQASASNSRATVIAQPTDNDEDVRRVVVNGLRVHWSDPLSSFDREMIWGGLRGTQR